ncbi:hypothetical protein V2J09_010975 [Rumex salicifolius]
MIRSNINIITRNAQGKGAKNFNSLRELIRMHNPKVLVLARPKSVAIRRTKCVRKLDLKGSYGLKRLDLVLVFGSSGEKISLILGKLIITGRGNKPPSRSAARLDRGLCNFGWRNAYPEASIKHLARNQSDHAPILMRSDGFYPGSLDSRPFRF